MKQLLLVLFSCIFVASIHSEDVPADDINSLDTHWLESINNSESQTRSCCGKSKEFGRACIRCLSVNKLYAGATIINGPTSINNTLIVNGDEIINGNLIITGTITINGSPFTPPAPPQYAFFTDKTSAAVVPNGSPIHYDTVIVSTSGISLDTGTGNITLANTGVYKVTWTVNGAASATYISTLATINGALDFNQLFKTNTTTANSAVGQAIVTVTSPNSTLAILNESFSDLNLDFQPPGIFASITIEKIA